MSKIVFFCIPARGHTNPTLGVVRKLVSRGHEVWYYSYDCMRADIEAAGARFVSCDRFDPQTGLDAGAGERLGKDIAFSVELIVSMTLAMDDAVVGEMKDLKPDVIVADSMAFWGRLIAAKLEIPFVSSVTTFAFNRYSARVMKQGGGGLCSLLRALPRVRRSLERLRRKGYPVKNVFSIIGNDNQTASVVYTSRQFQPCADTFSDRYVFVGPSMRPVVRPMAKPGRPLVYISLGTVVNRRPGFYRSCRDAFRDGAYQVILSAGEQTDIAALGPLPAGAEVYAHVDQMAVLQAADVFVTHCGMNSVNEALYNGVPLVLFPQTPEQRGVANRTAQLGAGAFLEDASSAGIRRAVDAVYRTPAFRSAAREIAAGFHSCGGSDAAAQAIERAAR